MSYSTLRAPVDLGGQAHSGFQGQLGQQQAQHAGFRPPSLTTGTGQQHHKFSLCAKVLGDPSSQAVSACAGWAVTSSNCLVSLRQGHRSFAQHGQGLASSPMRCGASSSTTQRGSPGRTCARMARPGLFDGQEAPNTKPPCLARQGHGPATLKAVVMAPFLAAAPSAALPAHGHPLGAGSLSRRRACVAHIRHALVLLQPVHHVLLGFPVCVVLVHGQSNWWLYRCHRPAAAPAWRVSPGHRVCELYVARAG